jgi:hypothetical protein
MGIDKITRAATGFMILAGLAATVMGCKDKEISVRADFNNDGIEDTISNRGPQGSPGIYLSLGGSSSKRILRLFEVPNTLSVFDENGDGHLDVGYIVYDGSINDSGWGTYIARGRGDGSVERPIKIEHHSKLYGDPRR